MKKVLSVLLAVCLFATLLVPAFAQGVPTYGKLADVAKVEFDKTQYSLGDIVTDNGFVDVTALLTCWDANGNRTNFEASGLTESEIRAYWSSNNEVLSINDQGKLTRVKNNTSSDIKVTLRVTLASGKQATTIVVVPANISESSKDAYGYRLANATVEKGTTFGNATVTDGTVKFTAPAITVDTTVTFADEGSATHALTYNAGTLATAAQVAKEIADNVATLTFKGIDYETPTVDGAVVTWTATTVTGSLTPNGTTEWTPSSDDLAVTVAPTRTISVTGTEGAAAVTAKAELVFDAAFGATKVSVFGVDVALNGKETDEQVAAKVNAALTAAVTADPDVFTFGDAKLITVTVATNTVTVAAAGDALTNGAKAAIDAEKIVYSDAASGKLAWNAGSDGSNANSFVYNIGDEITPILSSYGFTGDQKAAFKFAVRTTKAGANSHFENIARKGIDLNADGSQKYTDMYGLKLVVGTDADGYPQLEVGEGTNFDSYLNTYVYFRVLNDQFANAQQEKEFSIKLVGKAGSSTKILPAESYVAVNGTLDLTTLSKSVDGVKKYWAVEPYGNYQTDKEAAMIAKIIMETVDGDANAYGWTVKGLAPGVVSIRLYDNYEDIGNPALAVDSMKLNVGAGTVPTPTPSTANATVKVNEQVKLSVKNLNSDEYVKWSIDNNNVSLANFDGAAATVYGKKEGTAVVTAKVYESKAAANDGKDPVNTFKINVTVKAAESKPVTTPTTTAPTANPQTGDSIFANLF